MSDQPTLVQRLRHVSENNDDMYFREVAGRAADRIEELEKLLHVSSVKGSQDGS